MQNQHTVYETRLEMIYWIEKRKKNVRATYKITTWVFPNFSTKNLVGIVGCGKKTIVIQFFLGKIFLQKYFEESISLVYQEFVH